MKKHFIACLLVLAVMASAVHAEQPKTWKYTTLIRMSFPTLKKQMWMGRDKPAAMDDEKSIPDALDIMGLDGWELVAVITVASQEPYETQYYFKKPG